MALHGHTKIELTDINTGEVEVHESDNMITNWFHDVVNVPYPIKTSVVDAVYNPYGIPNSKLGIQDYFGGILCTSNSKNEDASDYHFGTDDIVTASAGDSAYNGAVRQKGSYNASLSTDGEKTHTFVWDWDAEHGNGTISTVCLVPREFGNFYASEDASPATEKSTHGSIIARKAYAFTANFYVGSTAYNVLPMYYCSKKGVLIGFCEYNSSTHKLKLVEVEIPYNKMSIFNLPKVTSQQPAERLFGCYNASVYSKTSLVELTVPTMTAGNYIRVEQDGKYLYVFHGPSSTYLSNNQKIEWYSINLDTYEISSVSTFTNTTGEALVVNFSNYYFNNFSNKIAELYYPNHVENGEFLLFGNTSKKIMLLNLKNKTCDTVKNIDGTDALFSGSFSTIYRYTKGNKFIYFTENDTYTRRINTVKHIAEYACNASSTSVYNKESFFSNAYNYSTNGSFQIEHDMPVPVKLYYAYPNTSISKTYGCPITAVYDSACYTTINNLDAPVVKTADKTMRITYTLTEEE